MCEFFRGGDGGGGVCYANKNKSCEYRKLYYILKHLK